MIQINAPDGSIAQFPDGTSDDTITAVMAREFGGPKTDEAAKTLPTSADMKALMGGKPSTGPDVGQSLLSGLSKSADGIVGAIGDVENLGSAAGTALVKAGAHALGVPDAKLQGPAPNMAKAAGAPTSADVAAVRQNIQGKPDYVPQTTAGRYAQTIGEMAPNALLGEASIPGRVVAVVGPAVGSQWAGDKFKGTPYEGAARVAGALTGGIAAGAATAPRAAALALPAAAKNDLLDVFQRTGVQPSYAAVGGPGAATVAKMVAENPIAGIPSRARMATSLDQTATAADRVASSFGAPADRAATGEAVQAGIDKFAKGTGAQLPPDLARSLPSSQITFGDKASALYTRADRLIGDTDQPIFMQNTIKALQPIVDYFKDPNLNARYANPAISGLAEDLIDSKGIVPWSDAAKLRTTIRNTLQSDPALRATVSDAQVNSIYSAITDDLQAGAKAIGGPEAAKAWTQANQFYRAGSNRINGALQKFVGAPANQKPGEGAYDLIVRMAGDQGGADTRRLNQLKQSLPPDLWGNVAATAVQRMGKTTAGNADLGDFSVGSFVTNYNKLSPQGRNTLFGTGDLRKGLDDLNTVAGAQKGVERAANNSKTAVAVQAGATTAGLLNPATTLPTLKVLGGLTLTGEAMTNPVVVRTMVGLERAAQASPQALQSQLGRLRIAAQQNAALLPIYQQLTAPAAESPAEQPVVEGSR